MSEYTFRKFVDEITEDYHIKDLWSIPISLILLSSIMILMPCFTFNHCVKVSNDLLKFLQNDS